MDTLDIDMNGIRVGEYQHDRRGANISLTIKISLPITYAIVRK